MYPVSNDYKTYIANRSREYTWLGSITLVTGEVISLDMTNIAESGVSVKSELYDSEMPGVGGTCASELDLTIYTTANRFSFYGATVSVSFRLFLGDSETYEDVPLGVFFVSEAEWAGKSQIRLTCYDAMMKFEQEAAVNTSGTPYQVLVLCCSQCGVTLGDTEAYIETLPNGDLDLVSFAADTNIATWRDAVGYIAALLGSNAIINRSGALHIFNDDLGATDTTELYPSDRFDSEVADFFVGITSVTAVNPQDGTEVVREITPSENPYEVGYPLDLGKNPFMPTTQSALETAVSAILTSIGGRYWSPFNATIPVNPALGVGDFCELYDAENNKIGEAIIGSISYSSSGSMTLVGMGSYPEANKTAFERNASDLDNEVNWDSSYYYDYVSSEAILIGDGESAQVINIIYGTGQSTHVDFHGQVRLNINANETYNSLTDTYSYGDVEVSASIFVDNEQLYYHPVWTLTDGEHTIDLLHFYDALADSIGTLTVYLTVNGGSASVAIGNSRGYVCGANYKDDVVAVGITQYPTKREYYVGEMFDYTGMVVMATLNSGNIIDVSAGCAKKPEDGSEVPEVETRTSILADVTYTDVNRKKWLNNVLFTIRPENRLKNIAYFVVINGTSNYVIYLDVANKTIVDTPYIRMRDRHPYQDPYYSIRTSNAGVEVSPGRIATFGSAYNTPFTHQHIQPPKQLPTVDGFIQFYNDSTSSTVFHFDKVNCNTTGDTPSIVRIGDFDFGYRYPTPLGYGNGPGGGEYFNYRGKVCLISCFINGVYNVVAYYVDTDTIEIIGSVPSHSYPHAPSVAIDELDKSYTFYCAQYLYGNTPDFSMIVYSDGEAHIYDISSDIVLPSWYATFGGNTYLYPRLYYDPVAEELLLYICYEKMSTPYEIETKCFRLDMDGHTVLGEIVLPDTITVSGRTVVLTGDPSSAISAYSIFNPGSNYGYYNDEGNNVPYPFIVGYLGSAAPDEYAYEKLIFIDNLYFNESDGNMIL